MIADDDSRRPLLINVYQQKEPAITRVCIPNCGGGRKINEQAVTLVNNDF
jgi:hypothetical protein